MSRNSEVLPPDAPRELVLPEKGSVHMVHNLLHALLEVLWRLMDLVVKTRQSGIVCRPGPGTLQGTWGKAEQRRWVSVYGLEADFKATRNRAPSGAKESYSRPLK